MIDDDRVAVLVLLGFSALFWSFYEQAGSSLNLFSDRVVERRLFGFEVAASQLQALPSIFVVLLAPVFTLVWSALGARGLEPNTAAKFSLALAFVGLAFLLPVAAASLAEAGSRIGLIWFVMTFCLMVCGELCIAPIAMNMVTRLCPARVVGMMMGCYFLSLSIGSFAAGRLAALTHIPTSNGDPISTAEALQVYVSTFASFGAAAIVAAALLWLIAPLLRRGMHEGVPDAQGGSERLPNAMSRLSGDQAGTLVSPSAAKT